MPGVEAVSSTSAHPSCLPANPAAKPQGEEVEDGMGKDATQALICGCANIDKNVNG